jgi:hypothetical protein
MGQRIKAQKSPESSPTYESAKKKVSKQENVGSKIKSGASISSKELFFALLYK